MLLALAIMSCTKEHISNDSALDYGRGITHDKIVLGNRLENPYKT